MDDGVSQRYSAVRADLSRRSSRPREPLEIRREPIGATVNYVNSLTIKVARDRRICVLTLSGDLDFLAVPGFLRHATQLIDERTERFVLDLAGLAFLDCAGARALAVATTLLPSGCPVIIRSLSPAARRVLDLLDMDFAAGAQRRSGASPNAGAAGASTRTERRSARSGGCYLTSN